MPQEPSPIVIDPHGDEATGMIMVTRADWAILGAWIYEAQTWIRSAGPCLGKPRKDMSDVPNVGTGAIGCKQGEVCQ